MKIYYNLDKVEAKYRNYTKYCPSILKKIYETIKLDYSAVEVSLILIKDDEMHQMNKQYRNIDRPTDILSFPDDEETYLGDIFINVDAMQRQAQSYGHSLKREFCFLAAHGFLHLLGYDHHTPQDEKEMFSLQEEVLKDIAPRKI